MRPPLLMRWLVRSFAPGDLERPLLEDLDELFRREAARKGRRYAQWWYMREACAAIPSLIRMRARRRASARQQGAVRMGAIDTLSYDIRSAVRRLWKSPATSLAAVSTLALCIGANTAIFSLVDAVLVQPLPYRAPDRLVMIWNATEPGEVTHISLQEVHSYRQEATSLHSMAASTEMTATFTGDDDPERVRAGAVTTNLFDTLQVQPVRGRSFVEADGRPGAPRVIMLSHTLWQRRFGGRTDVVGQVIRSNGIARQVVGVMPDGFRLPADYRASKPSEAWVPLEVDPANLGQWGDRSYFGVGRLRDGADPRTATAEFAVISDRWIRAGFVADQGDGGLRRRAVPLSDFVSGRVRLALVTVLGAVGFVLLIACANIANLLLAKAEGRRREMAVRAALGAGRVRMARLLLTESLLLGVAGGTLGIVIAQAGITFLKTMPALMMPRADEIGLNPTVLSFSVVLTLGTSLLFGLLPALQLSRPELSHVMSADSRSGTASRGRRAFRRGLVVVQLAFAVMLVAGAGLLCRSLIALYRIDLGFDPHHVLTAQLVVPQQAYPTPTDVVRFYRTLEERLRSMPNVRAAGAVRVLPLARNIGDWSIVIEGRPHIREENPNGDYQAATAGYFKAMGMSAVRGRLFTEADHEDAPLVAVINETMAARYWPGEDAIGKRFHMSTDDRPWLTIVGILRTVKHNAVIESPRAEMYIPHAHLPREIGGAPRTMTVVMKTDADPYAMAETLRSAVRGLDRNLPLAEVRSMDDVMADALAQPRFTAFLLGCLAVLAMTLAAVGIYSTISLLVGERTREIGIRLALGAQRRAVLGLVIGEGMALAGAGLAIGLAGAFALTRLMRALLYGVGPLDPVTFAAIPALFGTLAILACFTPARRAAALDPVQTLRQG